MPKPAFVDRNGWQRIILSQYPVYQVTHWQSPNRIPDPAEMTKPSLFLAQEKLLYVYVFENGVCGHPLPWQQAALAGNPLYDAALFSSSSYFGMALVSRRWYLETAATTANVAAH